ncbi:MAG: hypothetical protein R3308_11360, partial [Thiohalobacterales bacterium]|nr:hypothetical protein [Thiohalobacterales bacterium]
AVVRVSPVFLHVRRVTLNSADEAITVKVMFSTGDDPVDQLRGLQALEADGQRLASDIINPRLKHFPG